MRALGSSAPVLEGPTNERYADYIEEFWCSKKFTQPVTLDPINRIDGFLRFHSNEILSGVFRKTLDRLPAPVALAGRQLLLQRLARIGDECSSLVVTGVPHPDERLVGPTSLGQLAEFQLFLSRERLPEAPK